MRGIPEFDDIIPASSKNFTGRRLLQMGILRKCAKKLVFSSKTLKGIYSRWCQFKVNRELNQRYGGMSRRGIFTAIYSNSTWGGGGGYYSGPGSHIDSYIIPYCNLIKDFISSHKDIKRVTDLGCGDFNVASKWITDDIYYTGVDIVPGLIAHNEKQYASEHVRFMCLDIVEDELPDGDLCLIRQVLQHLNNSDIAKVLAKLKKYKYVIITEHVIPKDKAITFNADIKTGNHTRLAMHSGLYLDEPPFSLKTETLLRIPYITEENSELVSVLLKN